MLFRSWMKAKVDAGEVRFMRTALSTENVRPPGMPPFLSRRQIEAIKRQVPIAEHPLRFDAAWEGALVEQWLSAWNNELVSQPRPPAGAKVIVSGDHGIRPGRQSAALIAYTLTPAPMFWLLGEVCCDPSNLKATTPREDAQNIKTMLEQNGLSWEHVDFWSFDRAADSHRQDVRKDNKRLRNELAAIYGVEQDRFPRIDVPHKSAGSFITGFSALNLIFSNRQIVVSPRCVGFIRSCQRWNGDKRSPLKDILDGVRYGIETASRVVPLSVVVQQKMR